jgi:hypothetical protein
MNTTEKASTGDKNVHPWKLPDGEYFRKKREKARRMAGERLWVPEDAGRYQDRIARAVAREREHLRVRIPERETVLDQTFQCVCCGCWRGNQERREPCSQVCLRCVEDAGFWN